VSRLEASRAPIRRPVLGYTLYLTGAVLFAVNGSVAKTLLEGGIPATRLSQFRISVAFLVLLVVIALTRPVALRLTRAELPRLLMYGVLGIAMAQWLYFISIARLPVGIALLIEFTSPIMIALWFRFAKHEPVKSAVWWALILALVGLALVAQVWQGFSLDPLGVAAAFGAAVALVFLFVAGESGLHGPKPRDAVSLTMWGFGAGALFWAVVQPWWTFPWQTLAGPSAVVVPQWALLTYLVVLGTVVPFYLVLASMKHLRAAQASTVGMSEPVLGAVAAWLLLSEVLVPVQIMGGAVVLLGVFLAERSRRSV